MCKAGAFCQLPAAIAERATPPVYFCPSPLPWATAPPLALVPADLQCGVANVYSMCLSAPTPCMRAILIPLKIELSKSGPLLYGGAGAAYTPSELGFHDVNVSASSTGG